MSALRLATIPFEHVEAELAAFPLASEASFRLGTASLDPLVSNNDRLWRDAEKHVLNTLPSVPPDETVAIRDNLWFDSSNPAQTNYKPVPLHEYLRRLAESYLDVRGRPIEVSASGSNARGRVAPEARLRWSWMCRAMPPDLLRVARGVVNADANQFPLNPVIQQMLWDRGFAETHLHLGASPDFSLAWAALMYGLTDNESKHSDFMSPGACFEHGRDLGSWILYAAVVRLVLADWLFHGSSSDGSSSGLLQFACARPGRRLDVVESNRLATLFSELRSGRWIESPRSRLARAPKENLAKRFAQTRALYRRLIGPPDLIRDRQAERRTLRARHNPERRHDIYANDPLARVVGWYHTEAVNPETLEAISPETLFVAKALDRIKQDFEQDKKDSDFAALFWQVIRVRCLLYRHVVQRPLTPGLQWFVRFFSRIWPMRKHISDIVLVNTAARISGKDSGLRSLEIRFGTRESVSECLKMVRDVERATHPEDKYAGWHSTQILNKENTEALHKEKRDASRLEVGALFHFSRQRGGGWERGSLNAYGLDHSYPGTPRIRTGSKHPKDTGNPTGFRFARFYLGQRGHAQSLVSLFRKYPLALRTVRGIDLCTDEAGVPVWVMAPLIRWVRDAGLQAATQLRLRGEFTIPPLRTSVHAGEDFVHLLTGLRRLDDTVNYLQLEEGDRLGHALSLGIDPSGWCDRVGRVVQIHEERLFDLIWEWSCYSRHGIGVASERLAYVRTEMVRLARSIFGQSYPPEDLMDFVDCLHSEQVLRAEGFPDKPTLRAYNLRQQERPEKEKDEPEPDGRRLLRAYLSDERVWRRGRISEAIDLRNVKHEREALCRLQEGLRRKVGRLCLTIEVNPSSNLLIGDLGNFVGHPLWRLRPVVPDNVVSPLSVCIGSDDPLTFATTLPHEYQLLFDALILMGHSHEEAMKWIDEARDAGMQSRFTLSPDVEQITQGLKTPNLLGWDRPDSPP
jgi:hypothetical protein